MTWCARFACWCLPRSLPSCMASRQLLLLRIAPRMHTANMRADARTRQLGMTPRDRGLRGAVRVDPRFDQMAARDVFSVPITTRCEQPYHMRRASSSAKTLLGSALLHDSALININPTRARSLPTSFSTGFCSTPSCSYAAVPAPLPALPLRKPQCRHIHPPRNASDPKIETRRMDIGV